MAINFTKVSKVKSVLQTKTKARKKALEQQVSLDTVASGGAAQLSDMKFELLPIGALKNAKRRARKTSTKQLERVMRSVQDFNQCAPVVIDAADAVVNGHIVVEALQKLGQTHAWCVRVDHLSEEECQLLHVSLNRTAETGEWSMEVLGPLLADLEPLQFDLGTTGFTLPELDIIMQPKSAAEKAQDTGDLAGSDDDVVPPYSLDPVSVLGDLWQLGDNLLLCGDATDPSSYEILLGPERAAAIFTDAPWNIKIDGFVSGLGKIKHQDFVAGAGEMSSEEFTAFCDKFTALGAAHLVDGGVFYSCIDWRSVDVILAAGQKAGLRRVNIAVWNKGSGGMGPHLRSAHEFIPVFCKGDKLAVNNCSPSAPMAQI